MCLRTCEVRLPLLTLYRDQRMYENSEPFSYSGNNFSTVVYLDEHHSLSLVVIDSNSTTEQENGYSYDDLATDYAILLSEFGKKLDVIPPENMINE